MSRYRKYGMFAGLGLALGALLVWRLFGPVYVEVTTLVKDVPLEVQTVPNSLWVQPGEVVSVTYRIRNTTYAPTAALGRVDIEPASAEAQVKVFLTQCVGLNAFPGNTTTDYAVVFRVQRGGLFGSSFLKLRHSFLRAGSQ